LGAAVAAGATIALLTLDIAPPEMGQLVSYLVFSGLVTIAAGFGSVRAIGGVRGLSIGQRLAGGVAVASLLAGANVLFTAGLMFISTEHDLPLLTALLGFSSVLAVALTLSASGTITARLGEFTRVIGKLSDGDYGARATAGGGDELARLAAQLNGLASRLMAADAQQRTLDQERRDLTVAVSHDLRTPLASIRAMVEALEDGLVTTADDERRYHSAIRREIDRIARMLDDLFDLSRLDSGGLSLERRALSLEEVAAEVVEGMRAQAQRQGVRLTLTAEPGIPAAWFDGAQIGRAIANLLRNALEHTHPGGRVTVALAWVDGQVRLTVSDTGVGIPASEISRVWTRFHRGDPSRHKTSAGGDGAGLGLAIVRGIVEAHGGTVAVTSTEGAGATFTLLLPTASVQPSGASH
jgi:signal transduction histidine kinase